MKKLTVKKIKEHFELSGYQARHSFKGMKYAANKVAKENDLDPYDILLLAIENKPINGCYTHSYGFHTSTGRHLIESFSRHYYSFIN